jgi:dTDP-4-amino-4,6-dideoxygalactose transaminase
MPPNRPDFLIFGSPLILEEDILEVIDTLKSGWIGSGPKVKVFEEGLKNFLGSDQVVAVNSCTSALSLALEIIGLKPGDEVVTTPITFPATANVIVHRGATPVFVDVDLATGNLDAEALEEKITPNTKVILPVHLAGRPCDMNRITAIAQAYKLYVVEDAAHALEAEYQGVSAGTMGDFGAYSFYPTKSLTTGEGGLLTTKNPAWAHQARLLSLHGISANAWERYSDSKYQHYETLFPGYKYNLTDMQAALGLRQIGRLKNNLAQRTLIWELYDNLLGEMPGIQTPAKPEPQTVHARHLYTIYVDEEKAGISRDQLMIRLQELKVGTGVHYTAIHLHRFYREHFGFQEGSLPRAEWISQRTLSLPLTAKMTREDAEYVVEAIRFILAG